MSYYKTDLNTSLRSSHGHNPYCSFDFDRSNKGVSYDCQRQILDLERLLSLRDQEIADLRVQLAGKETENKQLFLDLSRYESDVLANERLFKKNETEMLNDISSLEIEVLHCYNIESRPS
jgi:hypothetical protein